MTEPRSYDSELALRLRYAWAVALRNASMYRRTWKLNILPNFFEPVFYLWSIGLGVGAYVSDMAGMRYVEFLAPGLVCVAAMNGASFEATYNVYVRLHYEKQYAAMLTTPLEPDDILLGELIWAVIRAAIYGGCFLIVTALFGLVTPLGLVLALPIIALTGILFAAIGLAFTLRIPTMELFSVYFTLFLTPLFLFSDIFFPLAERFSGGWLYLAEVLPLLHPVRLARAAYYGASARGATPLMLVWDVAYSLLLSAGLLLYARRWARKRLTD
jgi:lipooligosaccharide transport system permease protein